LWPFIGISAHFHDDTSNGEEGTSTQYFGRIENIVQIHFTSFQVTLLKGKWFDSNSTRRASPNLVQDECGFLRVKTRTTLPSHLPTHEPFMYPEDCEQVFFVADRINKGWSLIKVMEPRSTPVVYKGGPATCGSIDGEIDNEDVEGSVPEDVTGVSNNDGENEPVSADFVNEEPESNDEVNDDDQESESEEEDYEHELDVNVVASQEPQRIGTVTHRFVVRRYIGEQLISEETISGTESDNGNEEYIGESGSD
jgi:hypothetical protein